MSKKPLDADSIAIIRAVKAELARRDLSGADLVKVLGLNRNAVYARLRYEAPFNTSHLVLIAEFLNMSLVSLLDSAEANCPQERPRSRESSLHETSSLAVAS